MIGLAKTSSWPKDTASIAGDVMFNDFVLIGPRDDPARMRASRGRQGGVLGAMATGSAPAVRASRGDNAANTGMGAALLEGSLAST